jgi:energy-coupling factor transporter ATP-binding protein EcfA2
MARRREIVLNDERCPAVLKTANLEAYVAVAGPPQCGKSTFLACAHRLMEKTGALEGEVRLSAGPPRRGLAWLLENIYHRRILRSGTLEVEMNTLQVELQGTARISLSWLDIPGDLVINPTSQPVESQEAYADHLANADVLVLMIKAEDLLANRDIQTNQHLQALADTAYRFQEGLARQTGPVRQVPLLLVITQMCRLSTDGQRAEIEREAQTYFRHVIQTWQRGCRRTNNQAVIRIFCTSAVVTKLEDGHRIRHDAWHLEHEQVLQAIYWLTAQVTRVHMEQLTFVQKPRIQGELRRQVLWLEEESDGRVPGTTPLPPWDPRREHRTLSGL